MEPVLCIGKFMRSVSFYDTICELAVNRPERRIHQVYDSDLARIYALETMLAGYTENEILQAFAPIHKIGEEEKLLCIIRALKVCVRDRRPDWNMQ